MSVPFQNNKKLIKEFFGENFSGCQNNTSGRYIKKSISYIYLLKKRHILKKKVYIKINYFKTK